MHDRNFLLKDLSYKRFLFGVKLVSNNQKTL